MPIYADTYVEKNRERIMREKQKRAEEMEEIRKNEKKYKRYYDFKQEFKDVFDELEEASI